MAPKKKGDKKKKQDVEGVQGEDPAILLQNYVKFSKLIAIPVNQQIVDTCSDEELEGPVEQLVVDDRKGVLGPGGTRALCTAILGTGPGMQGGPYKKLKSLRLWRCNVGDDGAQCMAELLRLGGGDVVIPYLELFDNNIGPRGALALGNALSFGTNQSLMTLKLDYNISLGAEGTAALCRGLRTNSTLKQLHLPYCNLTGEAGAPLGEMLSYSRLALVVLNLQGNRLGGLGLLSVCPGLSRNRSLTYLSLADNGIGEMEEDVEALAALRDAIVACATLSHIDLLYNRIGEQGGRALRPAVQDNARIKQFLVDATLPTALFEVLHRRDTSGGKKKKKKGKKGKKKK
eukprot:CAMPEP_0113934316 /NCGR_PEP_ID=MMETSP1339-20121228/1651_1 /TAXON_ID=94617 /ORGANISM="Fibrocapsa japonica" /LENGTH=344 /DNA_ID=CAMNT_0000936063 /DNA_START=66 /DNA_END=1100 /DNA_ORIENTATION=+ /assembly_acc=CAM_ASM_000762